MMRTSPNSVFVVPLQRAQGHPNALGTSQTREPLSEIAHMTEGKTMVNNKKPCAYIDKVNKADLEG